jgi:hypothetical protein
MGIFSNKNEGKFAFAPKENGEEVVYTITGELKRVTCNDSNIKFGYKKLVNGNQSAFGYYDVIEVDGEKELLINCWKLYFSLKEANPEIGDSISIAHPKRGEYVVKVIK